MDLTRVAAVWDVQRVEAWRLLEGVEVKHISADTLEELVRAKLRYLFVADPSRVAAELLGFSYERMYVWFTAADLWAYLESRGIRRWLGDPTDSERLHRSVSGHQSWVEASRPSIGFVPRRDVDSVLETLRNPDGGQVVVVDGGAGSGKSAVVSQVAMTLVEEGWPAGIVRMDRIRESVVTTELLGDEVGLAGSPSLVLARVSCGQPALLVIEQLDAVSTYSGRMSDNFDVVADLVSDAKLLAGNIKVVLVVRTVDLKADPRLGSLLGDQERFERHTVRELDREDVKAHLAANGIPLPASTRTLELLCTPLHFAIFSRLDPAAWTVEYRTLQDLYRAYTEDLRLQVEEKLGDFNWTQITGVLVKYLSDNEVLVAPESVLDACPRREVRALLSRSVLVQDGRRIGFFHETYFDYLFARGFVAADQDLRRFLVDSGQHLFRRAQTRQVLEYLAVTDRNRFDEVVVELLTDNQIRSHLKAVVIQVLHRIDPTPENWQALDALAWSGSPVASKVLGLLRLEGWFAAVDELGLWEMWLSDPTRVQAAFAQLSMAARQRPGRVEALLRPFIGVSEEWCQRLSSFISWSLQPKLVDFAVDLVEAGQLDEARHPIAANGDFWMILHSLEHEDPAGAARLIGAFLHRGLTCAQQAGAADPFKSGHLSEESASYSVIEDVAAKAPAEFVCHVLPFVSQLAMADQHDPPDGWLPWGDRWHHRFPETVHTVDGAVFAGTDDALRKLAEEDPAACAATVRTFRDAESDELRFLACRALAVINDPDDAIQWLISDERNLAIGWSNSRLWASRELIEKHSPTCSQDLFETLEMTILGYTAIWEQDYLPERSSCYKLLSALNQTRMSTPARQELDRLEQCFASSPPTPPQPIVAHRVGPPIDEETSLTMSDDDWIGTLKEHNRDETNWDGSVPIGGAIPLAQLLGQRTKDDPERYAKLALRFTDDIHSETINQVLSNVKGIDVDLLSELCEHAHSTYGQAVGRWVCRAIEEHATIVNSRVADFLVAYSRDPDPDQELARVQTNTGQYYWNGDLLAAGLNSTRGAAALAAATVLFRGRDHLDTLLPAVERLAQDEILGVRVCAAEAVMAIMNHEPQQGLALAEALFDAPIDVVDTPTSERLLKYAVWWDPDRFTAVLGDALTGPDETAIRAGRIWAIARSDERIPTGITHDVGNLPTTARRGAAEVFAANIAANLETLPQLLNDDNPDVRQQAASAMSNIGQVTDAAELDDLLDAFNSSKAFPLNMRYLTRALKDMTTTLPKKALDFCEQAIGIAGNNPEGITTAHFGSGRDLITIVLRLYKQSRRDRRVRCLDIIDQLTDLNAYDVEEALKNER